MLNIYDLGWSPQNDQERQETTNIARITTVHRSHLRSVAEEGELNLYLSGGMQQGLSLTPATGDFVRFSPIFVDEQGQRAALVTQVLSRRSEISRLTPGSSQRVQTLASNIDVAFIVTSANEDFSPSRVNRFKLLVEKGHARPIVVLSKIDLVEEVDSLVQELRQELGKVPILPLSVKSQEGVVELKSFILPQMTAVFLGSSGVGKSTLVNELLGKDIQKTLDIRADDGKGRHTTTRRELFFLSNGGMVIDTPGLREVQVFASNEVINRNFSDLEGFEENCRFSDCSHNEEPSCAVREALESGELSAEKWESFQKISKEARHAQRKLDMSIANNDKRRWKQVNKDMRARRKWKDQT